MILDTSAEIAILHREPGWRHLRAQLEKAPLLLISAGTLQELLVVPHCRACWSLLRPCFSCFEQLCCFSALPRARVTRPS